MNKLDNNTKADRAAFDAGLTSGAGVAAAETNLAEDALSHEEGEIELNVNADAIFDINSESVDGELASEEGASPSEDAIDIEIIGFETITLEDGRSSDYAYFEHDGRQGAIVDLNQDGQADFMMYDANANGDIEDSEIFQFKDGEVDMAMLRHNTSKKDTGSEDYKATED